MPSMCGVIRMERLRNEVVRERVGVPNKLSNRVDRKLLKWFGHVEHMGSEIDENDVGNRGRKGEREATFYMEEWSKVSVC